MQSVFDRKGQVNGEPQTIPEVVHRTALRFGDRPALLWRDGKFIRTTTDGKLDHRATAFAIALVDTCSIIAKGDHIAMIMDNSPNWVSANLGIHFEDVAVCGLETVDDCVNLAHHKTSRANRCSETQ